MSVFGAYRARSGLHLAFTVPQGGAESFCCRSSVGQFSQRRPEGVLQRNLLERAKTRTLPAEARSIPVLQHMGERETRPDNEGN